MKSADSSAPPISVANPAMPEPILALRNLKTWFPLRSGVFNRVSAHVKAVDGVTLDIYRGEVLGLVGESGCGKTTLGKSLLQLIKPTAGEITYYPADKNVAAVNLTGLTGDELRPFRQKLQIVFQDPHSSLNPAFTIFGSLEDPLKQAGINTRQARRQLIGDLFEVVNLKRDYMDRYPHEFSGGQRQRIGIVRALSVNPELVVCDEAVSALDVSIQAQVLQLLMDLKSERNLTYLFITHDLSVAEYLCDRVAVMYLGQVVELADAASLFENALHPYTQALLSAIPVADLDRKTQRVVLQGDVPSPVNPPAGCSFHPRCPRAMKRCTHETPLMQKVFTNGRTQSVACHLMDDSAGDV